MLMSMAKITRAPDLEYEVGQRVEVKGYGVLGTVRYYGPHLSKSRRVVYGVELDAAEGDNNGTVYEKKYFDCKPNCGVLAVPSHLKSPDPNRVGSSTPRKGKKGKNKSTKATNDDFGGFGDGLDEADGFGVDNDSGFTEETLGGFGDEGGGDDDDGFGGFGEDEVDLYADTEYAQAESQEIVVVAKFDFPGVESEDLGFKKGERLHAKDIGDEEWWLARNEAGKEGMIPLDYVEIKSVGA